MLENVNSILNFAGAIIGVIGTVASVHFKKKSEAYAKSSFVYFMNRDFNFEGVLESVSSMYSYAVNSYEVLNTINTIFEQNLTIQIQDVTLLLRRKSNECGKYNEDLESIIGLWKRWVERGRINTLTIVYYDHDPDHYYTILGDKMVLCGHVLFDETKPTGTTVSYTSLGFDDSNELGRKIIKRYRNHFDNYINQYGSVDKIVYRAH